jgi:hypothetical protein
MKKQPSISLNWLFQYFSKIKYFPFFSPGIHPGFIFA